MSPPTYEDLYYSLQIVLLMASDHALDQALALMSHQSDAEVRERRQRLVAEELERRRQVQLRVELERLNGDR